MRTVPNALKFAVSGLTSALLGKSVLSCLWELTYRCTAKCAICSYWKNPSRRQEEMCSADIRTGLDKVYAQGCRAVNFTGGEPTMRPDLEDIVNHASRLGMWTSMVTNGSLLTRERMRALKDAGLDNLLLSLDSINPARHDAQRGIDGSHSKVVKCSQWLGEDFLTGHRTGGVMSVLSRSNRAELEEIVEFADRLRIYVVFQPYHAKKTGNETFNVNIDDQLVTRLLHLQRTRGNLLCSSEYLRGIGEFGKNGGRRRCYAGRRYFSIDPFGYFHPCVDQPSAGHLLRDDITAVKSSETLRAVESCDGCWYSFRGESDTTLSLRGCLAKLNL
ncbi:radical SAM/SPASM domain-containing protein, partial [Gemmatimonadota bacterium]